MLKYLFTAKFADGLIYVQNPENQSIHDHGRSCFTDILREMERQPMVEFELSDGVNSVVLNMINTETRLITPTISVITSSARNDLTNIRPIYFFTNVMSFGVGPSKKEVTGYKFGWQGNNQGGENEQYIMEIL